MKNFPQSIMVTLLLVGYTANADTLSIGAYAVAKHSSCGAGNIPGTIRELDKFFAHADFAAFGSKNFYWKDAAVKNQDWHKDTDYRASTDAATGFDGADASLISYIASHGVTSGGVYKALAGSKDAGGCYIPSSSLELGNQNSRYTILSTCQGLKIGSGQNPTATTGENPSVTWKNSSGGLNCILGYSNNMADQDGYGIYLLEKLKKGDSTVAEAFLSASEAVSSGNIPAVLCYGETQEDAAKFIAESKTFETTQRSHAASAWVYRKSFTSDSSLTMLNQATAPRSVDLKPLHLNFESINKGIDGNIDYDATSNVFSIKTNVDSSNKSTESESVPSLQRSIEIAQSALASSGISGQTELTYSSHTEDVLGGESGVQTVLNRKIKFKQSLAGFHSLSQAGSVEVLIGKGGIVNEITGSLLAVEDQTSSNFQVADANSNLASMSSKALDAVAKKHPGAQYQIVDQKIGYDAGNFFELKSNAKAVAEFTIEVTMGEFSRRFIEKIDL